MRTILWTIQIVKNFRRGREQINIGIQDGIWDFMLQGTNQHRDTGWNMGFYVAIQRMAFNLSRNKQLKWSPQNSFGMSMKQESPKNVKKVHILAFNYPIMLTIINVKELIQDSILFQKLSKVVQIFFSIIRTQILMLELN